MSRTYADDTAEAELERRVLEKVSPGRPVAVRDLARSVREHGGESFSEEQIVGAVERLEKKKLVALSPRGRESFLRFLGEPEWCFDLWLVAGLDGLSLLAVFLLPVQPPWLYARAALGLVFLLYLPGYALVEVVFPGRWEDDEADDVERYGLRVAFGFATVILVGLLLTFSPFGIRLRSLAVAVSAAILVAALVAAYRKYEAVYVGGGF